MSIENRRRRKNVVCTFAAEMYLSVRAECTSLCRIGAREVILTDAFMPPELAVIFALPAASVENKPAPKFRRIASSLEPHCASDD